MGITVGGIASGIDVDNIVEQITEIERKPAEKLTKQKEDYNVLISAYASLQQELSGLNSATRDLRYPSAFSQHIASGGDPDSYALSAGRFSKNGTYTIEVHQLATAEKLASGPFSPDEHPGSGLLSITVGEGEAIEIKVGDNFTLRDLANAINAEKSGVTAGVISDGEFEYLTLSADATGQKNTLSIEVFEDSDGNSFDAQGLSALVPQSNEHPEETPLAKDSPKALRVTQTAADAIITADGIKNIHRPENTFDDVIKDVSIALTQTCGPTSFRVGVDHAALAEKFSSFVESFNNVLAFFHENQKYNGQDKDPGILFGDQSVNRIKSSLMRLVSSTFSGNENLKSLTDVGIRFGRITDKQSPEFGKSYLELDAGKLAEANTKHPEELIRFFTQTQEENEGFAVKLGNLISGFNDPGSGIITTGSNGFKTKVESLDKQITRVEEKADRSEGRLRKRLNSLENVIAEYKATGDQLSGQLAGIANINRQISSGK